MPTPTREYKDINMGFQAHPVTGDIGKLEGVAAVKRAIKNLIFTDFFEVPFQPGKGSGITHMLFEPMNNITRHKIKSRIEEVITRYEPRATLVAVKVLAQPELNRYEATIIFEIENLIEPVTLDLFLERVR